jgi:sec-independent protein translocase protein TatB
MFDVGIWEIGVIGVVALVVLGPERLPKVARTAGHMFGRLQRYVANVKADINREMEMSEFAKVKEEVQSAAKTFESSVREHANAIETESRAIEKSATPTLDQGAQSQAELLAAQDASVGGLTPNGVPTQAPTHSPTHAPTDLPIVPPSPLAAAEPTSAPMAPSRETNYAPTQSAEQRLDLGIEAPRRRRSHA